METFEDLIRKNKPLSRFKIAEHYSEEFARAILKMLLKLGIKERQVYRFDERKKRLRGFDLECTGVEFVYLEKPSSFYSRIEVDGKYVVFFRYFHSDLGITNENSLDVQTFEMDWWSELYNYLRIELNGKRKKLSRQSDRYNLK